jgi:hypothetical protein
MQSERAETGLSPLGSVAAQATKLLKESTISSCLVLSKKPEISLITAAPNVQKSGLLTQI